MLEERFVHLELGRGLKRCYQENSVLLTLGLGIYILTLGKFYFYVFDF